MDKNLHKKYFPECPRTIALVDQYMFPQKDSTPYMCYNGISHPIYDCKGCVNFSLPLEYYPPVNQVHPQIAMVRRPHFQYRGNPKIKEEYQKEVINCPNRTGFILSSHKLPNGQIDPYGYYAKSSCTSCSTY